ncbi:MAG TPA: amidohydrolase family protein [Bacteroidota bacterium]|nr:amidohydrolase family protein [Bacteroidota bacterium]
MGKYLLPGFIDLHTNGIAGFDFTSGQFNPDTGDFASDERAYTEGLEAVSRAYVRTGVTRAVLTSLAAPIGQLKTAFRHFCGYKTGRREPPWNDVLYGINIEGTFIQSARFGGAHNPDYFMEPSAALFDELQEASGGLIKIVNVAPEWGEPALHLIEYLTSKGIVCAAGHTGATGDQYRRAISSGLRLAVHFLNGPTGSSAKSLGGGGATESVLRAEEMFAELIVDGYHVDTSYVRDTIRRKGFDKIVAITDSMFAAAYAGLKKFRLLGVEGTVSPTGEYLHIAGREDSLFGSLLTMDAAFANLVTWLTTPLEGVWNRVHEPLEFGDALANASAMCSRNPATLLGIYGPGKESDARTGSIEVGKSADILVADIERSGGRINLKIDRVFVRGHLV